MKVKKSQIIILALTVIVCVAVYLNWKFVKVDDTLTGAQTSTEQTDEKVLGQAEYVSSEQNANDYFSQSRLTRKQSKDDAVELLKSVIDSEKSSQDAITKANEDVIAIAKATEKESNIESLVKSKGFTDCVALISSEAVNVVVQTQGLSTEQASQIKEIAVSESGLNPSQVKIVEVKK